MKAEKIEENERRKTTTTTKNHYLLIFRWKSKNSLAMIYGNSTTHFSFMSRSYVVGKKATQNPFNIYSHILCTRCQDVIKQFIVETHATRSPSCLIHRQRKKRLQRSIRTQFQIKKNLPNKIIVTIIIIKMWWTKALTMRVNKRKKEGKEHNFWGQTKKWNSHLLFANNFKRTR